MLLMQQFRVYQHRLDLEPSSRSHQAQAPLHVPSTSHLSITRLHGSAISSLMSKKICSSCLLCKPALISRLSFPRSQPANGVRQLRHVTHMQRWSRHAPKLVLLACHPIPLTAQAGNHVEGPFGL